MSGFGNPIMLALIAAVTFGIGDFIGGRASRIVGAPLTVTLGQCVAGLLMVALLVIVRPAWPSAGDQWVGLVSGLIDGIALMLLYHGLGHGRVGVVASLASVLSVLVPVVLEMLLIRSPPLLAVAGIALAIGAVYILSYAPDDDEGDAGTVRLSLFYGLVAGSAFGVTEFLLGLTTPATAIGTMLIVRLAAVAMCGSVLLWQWRRPVLDRRIGALMLGSGLLDGVGFFAFMVAASQGLIGVAAALLALNVGVVVLLGYLVLGQTITRRQGLGLGLGGVSAMVLAASHG